MNRRVADKPGVNLPSNPVQPTRDASERRTERRLLCSHLIEVSWSGTNGHRRTEIGVLENLSREGFGLCVWLGTPFEQGTELSIVANRVKFTGCVTQCSARENGYFVGLRLAEPREWSDGFVPNHLLDVTLLDLW
jgi:hypothetical protein